MTTAQQDAQGKTWIMSQRRWPATAAPVAEPSRPALLDLPPLIGGHTPQPPPPPPPPPRVLFAASQASSHSDEQSQRRPSRKRRRLDQEPPKGAPWEDVKDWVLSQFDVHHRLLRPVLADYISRADKEVSARSKRTDGFFHAFFQKEGGRAGRGLATAVHYLLMEQWRASLLSHSPALLPANDRRGKHENDPPTPGRAARPTSNASIASAAA